MSAPDVAALLRRYRPVIQYDSHESFYADSVAMMTDRVTPGRQSARCNTLKTAAGKVIASAMPAAGQPQLNLGFLRTKYANGGAAHRDDYLDATGRDYVADARRMHGVPRYRNKIYGHAVPDEQGRLWLQYWLFYYYNDKAFMGIGLHEGDWELVQIRLDRQYKPNVLTYSQHREGARASWANTERVKTADGPAPLVYSARGAHACYFRPGVYKEAPVVPDYCDAKGPRIRPDVVVISDTSPAWVRWPGRWGSTPRRNYLESDSPRGPFQKWQWREPARFHAMARPAPQRVTRAQAEMAVAEAPTLAVHRDNGHAVIDYHFKQPNGNRPPPVGIVVSVDAPDDELPPATYTFPVTGLEGSVEHPLELEPRPYEVRVTAFSQGGGAGDAVTLRLGG
jgi:Vacuolar protein sorting-associated protein 62